MAVTDSPQAPARARDASPRGLRGVGVLLRRTVAEAWQDRVLGLSAEAGFWQLLSLPPLLLGVLGVIGYFGDALPAGTVHRIEEAILDGAGHFIVPSALDTLVRPSLDEILKGGRADVVSIGFFLSLWSGSSAMATYVNTITIAYDLRDVRSAVRSRLLALALYLAGVVFGIVMLPLLVLGPGVLNSLPPPDYQGAVHGLVTALYWPVVAVVSAALLATLYHVSVPVRTPWRRDVPGAVFAMGLWVLGSYLLRLYIEFAFRSQSTYGSLASPIAVLLFFYITALAVLLGAELNAEIDKLWPAPETARARIASHDAEASAEDRSRSVATP